MISERLRKRLRQDRPMVPVTLRMPEDVVDDLKLVAPLLGFVGYQSLIRYYVGQGLREDLDKLEADRRIAVLADALRQRGASDATIAELLADAGTTPSKEKTMAKKKVFVSFDYENDKHYKYLLEAWNAHPELDFVFSDATPKEIDSTNVGRVKAVLTAKINSATHTLVIVGKEANKLHKHHSLIGFKNWINFEVHQSKLNRNKIAAVKIDKSYDSPEELLGVGASWALSFSEAAIIKALNDAK